MGRFEEMQAFQSAASALSFTGAAQRLGMSKSMISQRIADLEARLGVRLINRTTRRLSLTEAGQSFLEGCIRALRETAEAEEEASRHGSELRGAIRIAAPLSFALLHLQPAIFDFMAAHPGLDMHLDMDDRVVDLVQGGYDMAIRIVGRLPDSTLVARRLAPSRLVVSASPAYLAAHGAPLHPTDLGAHACLIYSGAARADLWPFRIGEEWVPLPVRGRLHASSGDMLLSAAIAGHGIAQLPSFLVGSAVESGALVPILRDFPAPDGIIHAVYPQRGHIATRVRAFTDFLAARIGPDPYWDRPLAR
ncbi:MAG TPA: LysR family transcriptional regulator [Aliidongia sp.]|nr:LysR family transcriptional regulator [Aliidongia sp.]